MLNKRDKKFTPKNLRTVCNVVLNTVNEAFNAGYEAKLKIKLKLFCLFFS